MKRFSLVLLLAMTFTACDAPRDRRTAYSSSRTNSSSQYSPTNSTGTSNTATTTDSTDTTEDRDDTSSETAIPEEIKHCQWSSDGSSNFAESNSHLGSYTICQSTNKKDVWIQVKNPITDSQVCMIPTHNSGSSSVYVGEPRCLMLSESKKIYKVTLYSNRSGYQNFSITGVMVMKDKSFFYPTPFYQYVLSPDAYIYCSQFLDKYNDPSYCNAFKQLGQYVYKSF